MTDDGATVDTIVETLEAPPETKPLAKGTVVGRFVVLDYLGEGGMGVVYRAYDPELDRQIALKLMHPRGDAARSRVRVQREAQALAQLSHPNVVAVYDIGLYEEQVFIAMELVEGAGLREWLQHAPRSQAEILTVCNGAGEGLAAAHRAGLVHRDFKPENLIIARDGRVHVLDFGLARAINDRDSESVSGEQARSDHALPPEPEPSYELSASNSQERSTGSRRLGEQLTAAGTILGTPAYMAPEQFAGRPADARSDQFSFCVTLYEALYGKHPFGPTKRGVHVEWRPREPREPNAVPAWLHRALLRGLSRDAEQRFASMDELLLTLRTDPDAARHTRRRTLRGALALAAASAMVSIAAFVAVWRDSTQASPCAGADELVHKLWNPAPKAAIHSAFTASALPYGESAWRGLEAVIDRYASDWAGMRVETCRATRVRHEQSEALLERRLLCLDELAVDLGGMIEVLGHADPAVVQRSINAAYQLRPVRDCVAPVRPGRASKSPGDAAAVSEVRTQLSRARALERTGQYERGLTVVTAALERASTLGDRFLHADALFWSGKLHEGVADYEKAEANFFDTAALAERLGDDELRARAMSRLVFVIGYRRARHAEGHRLADMTRAVLDRLGNHSLDQAELESNLGTVLFAESRYEEAAVHDERALSLRERALGDANPEVASALNNLGLTYCDLSRCEAALEPLKRALSLRERILGPDHPDVAISLSNLGLVYYTLARYAEAGDAYARALSLRERVLPADHPSLAFSLEGLGAVRVAQGRLDEAIALLRRSVQVREAKLGPEHPDVANSLIGLAQALVAKRQLGEALELDRRALAIFAKVFGVDNADYALANSAVADILRRQGHLDDALARLSSSATILERELGADDPDMAKLGVSWGQALKARGDHRDATVRLERVLDQCERMGECAPDIVPQAQLTLAGVLATSAGGRVRALQLAQSSRAAFANLPAVADVRASIAEADAMIGRLAPR